MISAVDVDDIYKIPMLLHEQGLDDDRRARNSAWTCRRPISRSGSRWSRPRAARTCRSTSRWSASTSNLRDAYMSLSEALMHAGCAPRTRVNIEFIEATDIERHGTDCLDGMDAILVPGRLRRARHRRQDRGRALRARERRPLPRHLPRPAGRGDRVRAARRGARRGAQHRVRPRHAAPGHRADHRVAGPEGHGRGARRGLEPRRHDAPRRAGVSAARTVRWRTRSTAPT